MTKTPPAPKKPVYVQFNDKVLDVPCLLIEKGKAQRKFVDARWLYLKSTDTSYEDSEFYEQFDAWLKDILKFFKPVEGNDYVIWRTLDFPDKKSTDDIAFRFDMAVDIGGFFFADLDKVRPEDALDMIFDVLKDYKLISWEDEEEGEVLIKSKKK